MYIELTLPEFFKDNFYKKITFSEGQNIIKNQTICCVQYKNQNYSIVSEYEGIVVDCNKDNYDKFICLIYNNENINLNKERKTISNILKKSIKESVHVTCFFKAEATNLINQKNNLKYKTTYTTLLVKKISNCLKLFPIFNSCFKNGTIFQNKNIDIGIVCYENDQNINIECIEKTNEKKLHQIAEEWKKRPLPRKQPTFVISNIGTHGGILGNPIIFPPNVAILAVGKIEPTVEVCGSQPCVKETISFALSFDHRIIDGVLANKFIKSIINEIENQTI